MMYRISLEGLSFHAFHGLYPQEKEKGNEFTVTVHIDYQPKSIIDQDDIQQTIDYVDVYKIVTEEMARPSGLLETVTKRIIEKIFLTFSLAEMVIVSVSKLNPPIGGPCEKSTVTISSSRNSQ